MRFREKRGEEFAFPTCSLYNETKKNHPDSTCSGKAEKSNPAMSSASESTHKYLEPDEPPKTNEMEMVLNL